MIEIKVTTKKIDDSECVVRVEGCAKFLGKYSLFLEEINAIFNFLDKNDHKSFNDALNRFLIDRIMDKLDELDEDESEGEDE